MSFRSVVALAAMLSVAPLGILAAQQATAPTGTMTSVESPAAAEAPAAVTPGPSVPQPQYSPLFQNGDAAPTLGTVNKAAMVSGGANHTIVVSTLVLVLAIVILVLLIH